MKVRMKVDVMHERGDGQPTAYPFTKRVTAHIDLTVENAARGDAVVGSIEKALNGATDNILGIVRHY